MLSEEEESGVEGSQHRLTVILILILTLIKIT